MVRSAVERKEHREEKARKMSSLLRTDRELSSQKVRMTMPVCTSGFFPAATLFKKKRNSASDL